MCFLYLISFLLLEVLNTPDKPWFSRGSWHSWDQLKDCWIWGDGIICMWCIRIHLFMLLLPTKRIRVQELCLCLAYRIRGQPHARYKWILDGQVTWNSIGMDLWSHMSQPVWRRNQGICGFWPIPSLMKPTNRREWAITPQAASVAAHGSERAMRCVGLLMFCWICWDGVLAFTALSDAKTSLSRIPENLLTDYQRDAWYFYGSLCSANCIDAH